MKNIDRIIIVMVLAVFGYGCGDDSFPVPQSSSVDAAFEFSFTDGDFAPSEVSFTSTSLILDGVTDVTYIWNMGDGTTKTGANITHTYAEPGDYTVSLVLQTADDLDATEQTVTIRDPNALLVNIMFIDAVDAKIHNLDGTSIDATGFGTGLEYDVDNELLYFTDDDNGTLNSVNLDGSDPQVIATGLSGPRDLALDTDNNMVYVVDRSANAVVAVDLSDNSTSVLYDNASDGLGELPVGIDYHDGFVYVTCVEIDAEAVWKGNVDGSGISRIIDYAAGGYGYGIAVDGVNGKIYFDNTDNSEILRANLDGTSIEPVIATGNRAYGIVVDAGNSKLYWTERNTGNIYMSDLDGSNQVTVGAGYSDPRGLIFY